MRSTKYDATAAEWSKTAYADPARYLTHRAHAIVTVGPRLEPGDTLLDLACGDGALAGYLPEGVLYKGVDASSAMVEAARAQGRDVVQGDLNNYVPPAHVAATSCFRAIYYAADRRVFFEQARQYTTKKLVFDLNPRQFPLAEVRADAHAAGFGRFDTRPFFVPQRYALSPVLAQVLVGLEHAGPVARAVLRARFTYVCAASE